jgi:isocitrate dehydrogenase
MNHGQDARATLAAKGFCKSLYDFARLMDGATEVSCSAFGRELAAAMD